MEMKRKIHFTVKMPNGKLLPMIVSDKLAFVTKVAELRKIHGPKLKVIKGSIKQSDTIELTKNGRITHFIKSS